MSTKWKKKFGKLCEESFSEQAKWWLNGTWEDEKEPSSGYAEKVWEYVHMFIEVRTGQKVLYGRKKQSLDEGCDLDEDQAHRILEKLGETMTVLEMRKKFKALDIDKNRKCSLIEFLISKYGFTPTEVNEFKQGGVDPKILNAAQAQMDAAEENLNAALDEKAHATKAAAEAIQAAKDAATAVKVSEEKAVQAKAAVEEATQAEAEATAAANELKAAVEALEAKEKEQADKIAKLTKKSEDSSLSTVKRNSAINKLAQAKAEDSMPLRKAKITQNAALKRSKKAKKQAKKTKKKSEEAHEASVEAEAAAKVAKEEADAKEIESEQAKVAAHDLAEKAQQAYAEVEAELEEVKSKGTEPPQGTIWWMERIIKEKKKFLPKKGKNLIA